MMLKRQDLKNKFCALKYPWDSKRKKEMSGCWMLKHVSAIFFDIFCFTVIIEKLLVRYGFSGAKTLMFGS